MNQPREYIFQAVSFGPARNGRAVYDQDRQAQRARGDQLGFGAASTGVLADDEIDCMRSHQRQVRFGREGTAIHDQCMVGQDGCLVWHVDETQQVVVLWLGRKGVHMHASKREHDAAGRPRNGGHCGGNVGNMGPAVTLNGCPCRAGQRDVRHARLSRSFHRMGAHGGGKRMGGVDQMGHTMLAQIADKTSHAAKAADPRWHRLRSGTVRAACVAQGRGDAALGQRARECARLGRTAKQQDIGHG